MSDVRHSTRTTASNAGIDPASAGAATSAQRDGRRFDPPHQLGGTDSVSPPIDPAAPEYDVIQEPLVSSYSTGAMRTDEFIGDPLLQARQIAEHLQRRYADLHRREQRLNTQLADFDQERRNFRMVVAESEATLQERDAELSQRHYECDEREANCLALEHEMQSRKAELLQQESDLQHIQARWRDEWEQERLTLKQDLDERHLQLENDRAHFELVKEGQLADIQQERSLLLNRIRFQEEHLQKLRREFEAAQATFLHEKQRTQTAFTELEAQLGRRQLQLDRYREILEAHDESILRRHVHLSKVRRADQEGVALERQRLEAERREWDLVHESQHAELERKSEILQLNAQNLEARQARLDQVRTELEETNCRTLEMRLAVEEACAQLAQAVGPEVARQRIESAQLALSQHYRHARETLVRHRQELEQFQQSVLQQRDQFRAEQQTLTEWISRRDEELQTRADSFKDDQAKAQAREDAWQQAREHWYQEKLEAETVIHDLLRRLEGEQA